MLPGSRLPTAGGKKVRSAGTGKALASTIEAEIIPRLLLAFRGASEAVNGGTTESDESDAPEVVEFARIVLSGSIEEAFDFVESLRERAQTLETIYVDLVEPTGRRLGELWRLDAVDFVKVTVAVLRLQQVLHHFGLAFRREVEPREHGHRALLVPAPGEKGSFGHLMFGTFELALAAEFLRRDGWDACVDSSASSSDAVSIVRREWFDVIELSLSSESRLDELTSGICHIRKASRNDALGVMVGGPVFKDHPEMVTRVGADVVATNGRQAALQADNLMDQLRSR
ncbi:MAG: cobalamin-dependent protein [Reyranellaceae bacterium]